MLFSLTRMYPNACQEELKIDSILLSAEVCDPVHGELPSSQGECRYCNDAWDSQGECIHFLQSGDVLEIMFGRSRRL